MKYAIKNASAFVRGTTPHKSSIRSNKVMLGQGLTDLEKGMFYCSHKPYIANGLGDWYEDHLQSPSTMIWHAIVHCENEPNLAINVESWNNGIAKICEQICNEHPEIAIDSDIFGGAPHIKGFRLTVGDVLAKLYVYGSIEKVREIYSEVSEYQIREAIAFAQDFLESACASRKSY